MEELFSALDELNTQTVMIYPNCDAGGKKLIELIKEHEAKDYLRIFKNLPHDDYLSFIKYSNLMIGNSSSGIIESPSFNIPVINIGNRQSGRGRSENIIDVEPYKNKILDSINFALSDNEFIEKVKSTKNKFGDGKASEKIVKILKEIKIDNKLIQKQIIY
jgi:UDP-hydrolysing UDP-N-acetyl-D-glucosamine 2-epimerase